MLAVTQITQSISLWECNANPRLTICLLNDVVLTGENTVGWKMKLLMFNVFYGLVVDSALWKYTTQYRLVPCTDTHR